MIYLDYTANTPADPAVLDCFCNIETEFFANPNSAHPLGTYAAEKMKQTTVSIAKMLSVLPEEIIFTSGASESNNLAIKGIALSYRENGKHIISTCLEHPSVSGALTYLQANGYEIDLVDITQKGEVDLSHFKELLRKDTVLVSICTVDSELGAVQPIAELKKILSDYPNCQFHTDATQAVGKMKVDFSLADCFTFAPHKFYGLNGSGVLIKKRNTVLSPLIHGGAGNSIYRSGTPCLALSAACEKALSLAVCSFEERIFRIQQQNVFLRQKLSQYPLVRINSTEKSLPHILNISVKGVKGEQFRTALGELGVCVSVKSACSVASTPSRAVLAVTKDKKNALCSWRISLSHLTTMEELHLFLEAFDQCYRQLTT
jgi:Cysteine sulfinate desulfinase/cysteine desulfurase and related enzymes